VQNVFQCRSQNADPAEGVDQVQMEELSLPEDLVEGSERAWVRQKERKKKS